MYGSSAATASGTDSSSVSTQQYDPPSDGWISIKKAFNSVNDLLNLIIAILFLTL